MTTAFNPYADWLQIEGADRAPNHYALLGLPIFEDDQERIRTRYWERFEQVRRWEVGAYTETALKLMAELSQAFQCLSDPEAKPQYDDRLRRELATGATVAGELTRTLSDAPAGSPVAEERSVPDFGKTPATTAEVIAWCRARDGKKPKAAPDTKGRKKAPANLVEVVCSCGAHLRLPSNWAGKRGKCPRCGQVLQVPEGRDRGDVDSKVVADAARSQSSRGEQKFNTAKEAPAPGALTQFWQDAPYLVIGGAVGAVAVLIFCIAILVLSSGSPDEQTVATDTTAESAPLAKETAGASPAKAQPAVKPRPAADAPLYEWKGVLKKVLAIPSDAGGMQGVHLVVNVASSTDPNNKARVIDAFTSDLVFLEQVADYAAAEDGGASADPVRITGRATGETLAHPSIYSTGSIPRIELESICTEAGLYLATVGQKRDGGDFRFGAAEREIATALRTLGGRVEFEAVVEDTPGPMRVLLRLPQLDRRVMLPREPREPRLPIGQQVAVRADVTGQSIYVDRGFNGSLETALLGGDYSIESAASPDAAAATPGNDPSAALPPHTNETLPLYNTAAHSSTPLALAWNNGILLATSGSDGRIAVWDAEKAQLQFEPDAGRVGRVKRSPGSAAATELKWSPDGQWLLAAGKSAARVWNVYTQVEAPLNQSLVNLAAPPEWLNAGPSSLLMLLSGNSLALASPDVPTPQALPAAPASRISAFAVSKSGAWAAAGIENNSVAPVQYSVAVQPFQQIFLTLLGGASGVNPATVEGPIRQVMLREDPNAQYVRCSVQLDDRLVIYQQNMTGGAAALLGRFDDADQDPNVSLSWSRDGTWFAFAKNESVFLTEFGDGAKSANTYSAPQELKGAPATVAFAPDSKHLALGGIGQGLLIWNCAEKREVLSLKTESRVRLLDWRSDAQRLAALHDDGALTIWDTSIVPPVTPSDMAPQAPNIGGGVFNPLGPLAGGEGGLFPGVAPGGLGAPSGLGGLGLPGGGIGPGGAIPGIGNEGMFPGAAQLNLGIGEQAVGEIDPNADFQTSYTQLQFLMSNNAWDQFHAGYAVVEDARLTGSERSTLRRLKGQVSVSAKQLLTSTASVKATLGKSNPDIYQQQLRLVMAMVPGTTTADQAERLLNQSIDESGDLSPDPVDQGNGSETGRRRAR